MKRTVYALLMALAVFTSCKKDPPIDVNNLNDSPWTLVGTINSSAWGQDFAMNVEGNWHVIRNVIVTDTDEFKFRKNKSWDTNLGAGASGGKTKVYADKGFALIPGGGNIQIAAGKYDMYIAPDNQLGYIVEAGSKFTHVDEGKVVTGGTLSGDYNASLAPSAKKANIAYQLNVYSFADSDGDGWGDFQGIIDHLDYLDAMGVTSIWLSPVQKSQSYHAYDITDYYAINPIYGGKNATSAQAEAKFQELINKAKEKNIVIYMDYVLNHSGDQCSWFKSAMQSPDSKYRSYYVISDDYTADVAAGKVDNFAGQRDPLMGAWHAKASGNAGYNGVLHFKLDVSSASAPKLTITQSSESVQSSNTDTSVNWFIWDNNAQRMYKTGTNIYEITLRVNNNWGILVRSSATEWGDHKWGAAEGKQSVTFGTPITLVKGDAANDIVFSDVTWYFGSFDASMPDLNYGPYASCSTSPAFIDLAASADKWINMGIGGLRLDAVMWIYQCNATANVSFLSAWYDHCNATYKNLGHTDDFFMVGEAYDYNAAAVGPYYKGLPSCFDFPFYGTLKDRILRGYGSDFASTVAGIVSTYTNNYNSRKYTHSGGMISSIKLSNHDEDRVASDLGNHDQKKRLAAAVLLTSPGKPFIYQGEELGYWGVKKSGDENVRQPIYWEKDKSVPEKWCGFDKSVLGEGMSVSEQAANDRSLLQLYRHFAYARNVNPALAEGTMQAVSSGSDAVAAWYMTASSQKVLVLHNFSGASATVDRGSDKLNKIVVANGEVSVSGSSVTLPAYSSVVFAQ